MLALIILGIMIGLAIIVLIGTRNANSTNQSKQAPKTIRCPNCGSPATVKGDQWECGWCGDYGTLR